MKLYSPVISGSLTVSGSTTFIGNITMSGSLSATASNASLLDGTGSVGFTTTASFTAVSSSQQQISSSLLEISRSYATTGSNTFTGVQNFSNTCNPIGFNSVASLYTAGGLQVSYDSYFSSSVFVNGNLTVFGTQSVVHVSSSQFNIGTNIITVNTATPSIRYGGLSVYDSGSTGLSGSIFWDSEANHWVYANASGSGGGATYAGGMFISGPRSSGLGCEQGTTSCMLLVGQGGDHLTSSQIYHSSTVTCVPNYIDAGGFYGRGTTTVGIPFDTGGTKAYFDGSSINGPALSLVSDAVGRTVRLSATTGSTAVGKIDMNTGEMNIGTNVSLPFVIYTNNCARVTTTSTGITCFGCQICAPFYAGGTSYTIDFLVVAGGGGGGGAEMSNGFGGGGGAGGGGGYLASSISVNCSSTYPIVVGTGGAGGCSRLAIDGSGLPGCPGTFSSAFGFIAIGGGAGPGDEGSAENTAACVNGGSGGGQGGDSGGCFGVAVIGQGNNGSIRISRTGGGGGGALNGTGGNSGGSGRQWLNGNFYAGGGGGGGGGNNQILNPGGAGGGGQGSRSYSGGGTSGEPGGQSCAGAAGSGGGGGGAGAGYLQGGQPGGSGVVIVRYFGSQRGSGGTITSSGGYTYHTFDTSSTYTA